MHWLILCFMKTAVSWEHLCGSLTVHPNKGGFSADLKALIFTLAHV